MPQGAISMNNPTYKLTFLPIFKKDLIHACILIDIEDVIKLLKIYLEDKDFKYILSENGDVILFI